MGTTRLPRARDRDGVLPHHALCADGDGLDNRGGNRSSVNTGANETPAAWAAFAKSPETVTAAARFPEGIWSPRTHRPYGSALTAAGPVTSTVRRSRRRSINCSGGAAGASPSSRTKAEAAAHRVVAQGIRYSYEMVPVLKDGARSKRKTAKKR